MDYRFGFIWNLFFNSNNIYFRDSKFQNMPLKEKEIEKLYYGIGEVSQMLQVNPSLIRFWEKKFPILKPVKNKKGDRLFTLKEIEKLKEIHKLVKEDGFKLSGAKKKMRAKDEKPLEIVQPNTSNSLEAIAILQTAKSKLLLLKESLG
jgi:DNA-binding transcriptional MerR regulator